LLSAVQSAGERNRVLYLLKSRGMAHSNQMREFVLSNKGIDLVDVYVGPGAVYTGAARLGQEARDKAEALMAKHAAEIRERELNVEHRSLQAQIVALQTRLANLTAEQQLAKRAEQQRAAVAQVNQSQLARVRNAD
jgi:circadian clock protein KaiC